MLGFCKGLHCAGCGKSLPLIVALFVFGAIATASEVLFDLIVTLASITAGALIGSLVIIAAFMRKGPRVVHVQTETLTYCERKALATGDSEWLALVGGRLPAIEGRQRGNAHTIVKRLGA